MKMNLLRRASPRVRFLPLVGFFALATSATMPRLLAAEEPSAPLQASDEFSAYAALGSAVAQRMGIAELTWNEARFTAFVSGLRAGAARQGLPFNPGAQRLVEEITQSAQKKLDAKAAVPPPDASVDQFMRSAQLDIGMQRYESGLLSKLLVSGAGARPRPTDSVIINLTAKGADGQTDLPQLGGKKMRVRVSDLLPGLAEGVQMLALGAHAALILPPHLSFGSGTWPAGVEHAPILFIVELLDVVPADSAPLTP